MEFCEIFEPCENIDGRLLINRTMDGAPLALDEDLALGAFSLDRPTLRPYAKLVFEQRWFIKEMCYGPTRSVLGLAPCETVTTEVRTVEQRDFTSIVQQAMESSEVTTNTRVEGRELIDNNWDGNTVDLSKITIGEWGSFWQVVGAVAGAVVGGPIGAGVGAWVGGAIDDATSGGGGGGGATATGRVLAIVDETLETVQKSQSQHLMTEMTSSFSSTRERSITRSFKNPYQDRTLELRFIPTFRHFVVVTTLIRFDFGLSLNVGKVRFPRQGVGVAYGDFLQARLKDQRMMSVANAELGLDDDLSINARSSGLSDHLNNNSEAYGKELLRHMHKNRDIEALQTPVVQAIRNATKTTHEADQLEKAFAWSDTFVQDNSIFVPMADPSFAVEKLNLTERQAKVFNEKLEHIKPGKLKTVVQERDLYLFAGTHVEAAPGHCRLPDLAPVAGLPVEDPVG
jgi:hypothetical protein